MLFLTGGAIGQGLPNALGVAEPGPKAQSLTDLTRPVIDWVALAKGFGVPACSVSTDNELADALMRVLAERGPNLIEVVLV